MLWDAVERIRVDTIFVTDIQFHHAAAPAHADATLDAAAGLRAPLDHVATHPEKLATAVSEYANARANRVADEHVRLAEPRVVDEGVLHRPPTLEIDVHGGRSELEPPQRARPQLVIGDRLALRPVAQVARHVVKNRPHLGVLAGARHHEPFEHVIALVGIERPILAALDR